MHRCTLQSVLTATPTADTATQLSDKASPTNSSAANDKRLRSRPSQTNQLLNDHANADKQTDASSSSHTCCSPATATTSAVSSDTLHASHDYKPVLNGQSSAATSHGGSPSEQTLSREHPSSAIPANLHNNCQEQSQGLTPCSGDLGAQADADSNTKSLSAPAVAQDSSPSDRVHLLAEAKANSSEVTDEQQLWHRGIVEALLRSSQQWPALDYEVLANKAGQQAAYHCSLLLANGTLPGIYINPLTYMQCMMTYNGIMCQRHVASMTLYAASITIAICGRARLRSANSRKLLLVCMVKTASSP